MSSIKNMPETGFAKIKQIIGDKASNPPTPPVFPVSKSTWWEGCRSGRFPTLPLGNGLTYVIYVIVLKRRVSNHEC